MFDIDITIQPADGERRMFAEYSCPLCTDYVGGTDVPHYVIPSAISHTIATHHVALTHFQVVFHDEAGNELIEKDGTFELAPPRPKPSPGYIKKGTVADD